MKKIIALLLLLPSICLAQLDLYGWEVQEDKAMHYLAGVAITSISHDLIFERTRSKEKAIIYSMATTLAVATFKEVFIDKGHGDGQDIAASMYGAITVGLVIEIDDLFRKKCKRRRRWKIC